MNLEQKKKEFYKRFVDSRDVPSECVDYLDNTNGDAVWEYVESLVMAERERIFNKIRFLATPYEGFAGSAMTEMTCKVCGSTNLYPNTLVPECCPQCRDIMMKLVNYLSNQESN